MGFQDKGIHQYKNHCHCIDGITVQSRNSIPVDNGNHYSPFMAQLRDVCLTEISYRLSYIKVYIKFHESTKSDILGVAVGIYLSLLCGNHCYQWSDIKNTMEIRFFTAKYHVFKI